MKGPEFEPEVEQRLDGESEEEFGFDENSSCCCFINKTLGRSTSEAISRKESSLISKANMLPILIVFLEPISS
jgi:hypothetical protein